MALPRLVSVLPSDESGKHWVYFEDGRIALVDPKNASVFQVTQIPEDLETAAKKSAEGLMKAYNRFRKKHGRPPSP